MTDQPPDAGPPAGRATASTPRSGRVSLILVPAVVVVAVLASGQLRIASDATQPPSPITSPGNPAPASGASVGVATGAPSPVPTGTTALESPPASVGTSPGGSVDPAQSARPGSSSTGPSTPQPTVPPPLPPGDYLLMPRAELLARPTSGPAWDALLAVADGPLGRADLSNQDARHGVRTLAVALVYARTGDPSYREHARAAIMSAIGTETAEARNSILALGRQLGSYVLAADLIDLDGAGDVRFRAWLDGLRTRDLGGHGRWRSLVATHEDAGNNWGAFAGASRIAASLYLGDGEDVLRAAAVLRGFLGDRDAWAGFQPVDGSRSWACDGPAYTPVNRPCVLRGIDVDGAIVRDIDRGGNLRWPPGDDGIRYTLESLQGLVVQAELLTRNGYGDAWAWSDTAIARAARFVTASGDAGGETWNRSDVTLHLPWLLDARYDLGLPTQPAGAGRLFGFTDWLYGS